MDTMTRLFLVRHGETDWNKSLKYQGHKNIPLNKLGRQQAEKIGARLKDEKIDVIYSSTLVRAIETAEIISRHHGLPVNLMPEFKETNFGVWEGLTYNEINTLYPDVMEKWRDNPKETRIPGGESLGDVAQRCQKGLNKIITDNPGKSLLLVAHGGIIRVIVALVLGMNLNDYWKIMQNNVSLTIIEYYDNNPILCLLNDTGHLRM